MSIIDWHTHPYGHGEKALKPCHDLSILKNFVREAKNKGLTGLGFTDHEGYISNFNFNNLYKIKNKEDIEVKIGVEFDYKPDREEDIKEILDNYPFEYSIGSVHHIDNWNFDNPKYKDKFDKLNPSDLINVYKKYFSLVHKSVKCNLFDIIGHFDLIKIFDYPVKDRTVILDMVDPILNTMKKNENKLEINMNGLNKPINEIYPACDILKQAKYKDIDIVFSSDAHTAERVGENFILAQKIYNIL